MYIQNQVERQNHGKNTHHGNEKKNRKKERKALNENYTIFKTQGTNEIKFIAFSQTTTKSYMFCIHTYIKLQDRFA